MAELVRISAEEARTKVLSRQAILVCAYEDEEKFRNARLEGSISLNEFRDKITSWSKEQEIIFY
jgi:hypothetical protein